MKKWIFRAEKQRVAFEGEMKIIKTVNVIANAYSHPINEEGETKSVFELIFKIVCIVAYNTQFVG